MSQNWDQIENQNVQFTARSIGGFTATCTVEEVATNNLTITQHPVQQGAAITDHSYLEPVVVSIKFYFDNSTGDLSVIYQNLLDLQATREPFSIVTGKKTYNTMLFKSLRQNTDPSTENCLSIDAEFQQIIIASIQTTSVPQSNKQAAPQQTQATSSAGEKNAQPVDTSSAIADRTTAIANNSAGDNNG